MQRRELQHCIILCKYVLGIPIGIGTLKNQIQLDL